MAHDEFEKIVKQGEGQYVEFKESPKHIEKDICAFANAGGGIIYIGVTDHGDIKPVNLTNKLKSQIQEMALICEPRPSLEIQGLGPVVAVQVHESLSKPVKAPEGFYLRIGATSQKLKRDEIFAFAIKEGKVQFDTQYYTEAPAEKIISPRHIEIFRHKARLETALDPFSFLKNLGCLKHQAHGDFLTFGGLLFFTENPQEYFPQATVTLLLMEDESTILEQKILKGTLVEQVENSFYFLRDHLRVMPNIQGLRREDIPELPELVIRELIVNAILHRDYFDKSADIAVKIYPSQVEFANPGKPGPALALENIYGHSYRRNPLIADLFYRLHFIERAGTGLLRVRETLKKMNLAPLQLQEEGVFFVVRLPRPGILTARKGLNERQNQLLSLPAEFFPFSTKNYAKQFGISERMARQDIKKLLEQKILAVQREGREIRYGRRQ